MAALKPHKITDHKNLRRIFDTIENKDERFELNLYIVQPDDEVPDKSAEGETEAHGASGSSSPERSPNT